MEINKDLEDEYVRKNLLEMQNASYFEDMAESEQTEKVEMEKAEELRLRKKGTESISTTYSRRPKKAMYALLYKKIDNEKEKLLEHAVYFYEHGYKWEKVFGMIKEKVEYDVK
ncbi:hypothetical protein L1987_23710 [Smallanthus sonchifolius]|uniref:Uncharacterized protein n=1 Tax=Smallanthus sonchifolius TaxID=185202 RepID=A0ACB9IJW6_9ASTR|nr:hypothetical protein L1987_23710 [Smallanthus sonchifolius]